MYSLWNEKFHNIESYIRHGYPKCTPMTFNTSKHGLTDKFKLEELDALTTQYKDENDFFSNLSKYGQNYIKNQNYPSITMTHSRGDRVYEDDVIYGDLMVHEVSREVIYKKQNIKDKEQIVITNSEKINGFIEYIKGLALNKKSRKYLLDPYDTNCKDSDMFMLDKLVDSDVYQDGKVIKKGLKGLLLDYIFIHDVYQGCIETGESTLEVKIDLDKINNQISNYIRSNYRVFRNLVVWENRFVGILNILKETTTVPSKKVEYIKLLEEIKVQKKFRNNLISEEMLETFYRDLDYMYEINEEQTSTLIENEELSALYKQGGIEEVMNNYDLDDIYGSLKNYKDAVNLGIIKEKK